MAEPIFIQTTPSAALLVIGVELLPDWWDVLRAAAANASNRNRRVGYHTVEVW
jgi:hypothetical protein